MDCSDKYLFLHAPKTAGTSVFNILRQILGSQNVSPAIGADFNHIDIGQVAQYRMVAGHLNSAQIAFFPGRKILTFFRDPVDRSISKYYFYRNDRPESDDASVQLCRQYSLDELLDLRGFESNRFWNSYVRQFASVGAQTAIPGTDALKRASEILATCEFVGIYEDLMDSLDLMSYTFGWPPVDEVPRNNVTSVRKSISELDPKIIKRIRAANELDNELYEYARSLFRSRKRDMLRSAIRQRTLGDQAPLANPVESPPLATGFHSSSLDRQPVSAQNPDAGVRIVGLNITAGGSEVSVVCAGDLLELAVILMANAPADSVSVSIQIHNRYRQLIFSDSTKRRALDFPVTAGNVYRISFQLSMKLTPGQYNVSAAAASWQLGEQSLCHYIEDATTFGVRGYTYGPFGGIVDLAPDGSVAYVDPDFATLYPLGEELHFGLNSDSSHYSCTGWSTPEDWGRWSIKEEADLFMKLDHRPNSAITMTATIFAFCPPQRPTLAVEVLVNGNSVTCWNFVESGNFEIRQITIPVHVLGDTLHMLFRIREPRSPADLGISTDTRTLGIGLVKLCLFEKEYPGQMTDQTSS